MRLCKIVLHVELHLGKKGGKEVVRRFGQRDTVVFVSEPGYTHLVTAGPSFRKDFKVVDVDYHGHGAGALDPYPFHVYLEPLRGSAARRALEHFLNARGGENNSYGWIEESPDRRTDVLYAWT